MNRDTGQKISDKLQEASKLMDEAVSIAKDEATTDEFIIVRNAVGIAMGELLLEVLNRIYYDHQEIKPKGWD